MPITTIGRSGAVNTANGANMAKAAAGLPGDFVCVVGLLRHATATFSTPSGWLLRSSDIYNTNRMQVFTHRFDEAEPASTAFAPGSSLPYILLQWTLRGVDLDDPFLLGPTPANSSGTSVSGPSMTPGAEAALLWWWFSYQSSLASSRTITAPAGLDSTWTQVRTAQGNGYLGIGAAELQPVIGVASGAKNATVSASGDCRGLAMALRAAVEDTGADQWFPFMNWTAPSMTDPGDVLDIGPAPHTNHFSVQLAAPDGAAIETHDQDEIAAGYRFYPWFYGRSDGQAVRMRAPVAGPTTSGASSTRCELRELAPGGANAAFDALTGTHVLHVRVKALHLPPVLPDTVFAQLHNGTTDRVAIRTQLVTGTTRLRARVNGSSLTPEIANWGAGGLGDEFEAKIQVVGGFLSIFYNDMVTPLYTSSSLVSTGSASWYFKAGCYLQTPATGATDDPLEYGEVEIRDLYHSHA